MLKIGELNQSKSAWRARAVEAFSKCMPLFAILVLALVTVATPYSARAQDSCAAVFSRASTLSDGARFLHDRNGKLHTSRVIERSAGKLQKPHEKIGTFLNRLEKVYARLQTHPQHSERAKQIILREFVIKESEIPESYFDLQIKIARDRGHGNIILTPDMRRQIARQAVVEQEQSLRKWIDYFFSADAAVYPMWTKYWALTSISKMGKFDSEAAVFASRSKGHVSPFVELNREAFALTIDNVVAHVEKKSLKEIENAELLDRVT